MKRILILLFGMLMGNIGTAQTEKTEPLKKIDSIRGTQIEEQREGETILPITTTVNGIPAAAQPNAVETRNATTGSSVNPGTPKGNLPLGQGKQAATTSKNRAGVNTVIVKAVDTTDLNNRRNRR